MKITGITCKQQNYVQQKKNVKKELNNTIKGVTRYFPYFFVSFSLNQVNISLIQRIVLSVHFKLYKNVLSKMCCLIT